MPYTPITFNLKTDFTAKNITIVNYNSTINQIKQYMEMMQSNIQWVKSFGSLPVSETDPEDTANGDFYFRIITP